MVISYSYPKELSLKLIRSNNVVQLADFLHCVGKRSLKLSIINLSIISIYSNVEELFECSSAER